jgi:nucleosome assembly protein 1-like 1
MGKKKPQQPVVDDSEEDDGDDGAQNEKVQQILQQLKIAQNPEKEAENFVNSLDAVVRDRVRALQGMQAQSDKLREEYNKEVHALLKKYEELHRPTFTRRCEIVNGASEATDEETQKGKELFAADLTKVEGDLTPEMKEELKKEYAENTEERNDTKGIPGFWLRVLKQNSNTEDLIQERDEAALEHLVDVRSKLLDDPKGFQLEFEFSTNPYFSETVLTKKYLLVDSAQDTDELLDRAEGITITWKEENNLTVIKRTKKQRHKSGKAVRTVTQTEPCDSFFNFFNPPQIQGDSEHDPDDLEQMISTDFELGKEFRDSIVERALDWYTGMLQADEYDEEEEEEEEDEEEEEEERPKKKAIGAKPQGKGESHQDDKKPAGKGGANNPECNQQ